MARWRGERPEISKDDACLAVKKGKIHQLKRGGGKKLVPISDAQRRMFAAHCNYPQWKERQMKESVLPLVDLVLEGHSPQEVIEALWEEINYRGMAFSGYDKPKRTPGHPTKSHAVLTRVGGRTKMIRFGEQGADTAGEPKEGESERMKKKRASFKARHAKNIAKGKSSAAYWADKVKW